jgi:hypothetical protein
MHRRMVMLFYLVACMPLGTTITIGNTGTPPLCFGAEHKGLLRRGCCFGG